MRGRLTLIRLALISAAIAVAASSCGGGGSSYVAKVGSKPITKAQLQAVLSTAQTQYRSKGLPFPRPGSAEYLLLREQALDFLVQQTRAHLADAKIGIKPEDRLVTHSSFLKVTAAVHVTDGEIRAHFAHNRKHYQRGTPRALDRGVADEIRNELSRKRQAAAMHRFVSDAKRRWPVTYAAGYSPVSEMALTRRVWTQPPHRACDLPAGSYSYAKARAHGCLGEEGDSPPGVGYPVCTLIDFPGLEDGFTSAEMDDGFADYLMDNAGSCTEDPRLETVQVQPRPRPLPKRAPVKVSYLHLAGSATLTDPPFGFTLRYPRRLRHQRINYGSAGRIEGVKIANYPPGPVSEDRPLSRGAIELTFALDEGGPEPWGPPSPPAHDTRFPIRIPDSALASGRYDKAVWAHALPFFLTINAGSAPSARDRAAIRAIVASIRFTPLRTGRFTPGRYYVLDRASRYPLGSVTPIAAGIPLPSESPGSRVRRSARFYLVHGAEGFWTITWPNNSEHGYKDCDVRFKPSQRQFTCRNGAAWDQEGQVVRNPDPARFADDQLVHETAPLSYDGFVLVNLPPST